MNNKAAVTAEAVMKEKIIEWLDSLDVKQLRCVWFFICGMTGKR